jgi:glutamate synthase domain-containing protein 2/glutamate synthase domain-containing protein 1/glutamate synthase domain-containing protein 3
MHSLAGIPQRQGLYDPAFEHEACGMGFLVDVNGRRTHELVRKALTALQNLTHRGACGCDPLTGDGSGVLLQLPHEFLRRQAQALGFELPGPDDYGLGMFFMPRNPAPRQRCVRVVERVVREEGQELLGWRAVPVDESATGAVARRAMPFVSQVFIKRGPNTEGRAAFERALYVIRRRLEKETAALLAAANGSFYVCSLSTSTVVYKGQLMPDQLVRFYADLNDPDVTSALALIHQRFSTNTFPSWERAHPYRFLCHNGEINTLRGNVNWMHAREKMSSSPLFGADLQKLIPIVQANGSDSAIFDNVLEFLLHTGRSLAHAVMMMIPEAWQNHSAMSDSKRAFYQYHSCVMEPWDGPAAIAFTDGRQIGAVLDRNGLRPSRYVLTRDGLLVMASETGVLDIEPELVAVNGRLQPGRMLLIDTEQRRIIEDEEIKESIAARKPYRQWLRENLVNLDDLPDPPKPSSLDGHPHSDLMACQVTFGYTLEELRILLAPMAANAQEPVGSMGTDTPLAVLSNQNPPLFNYFKQVFAQVTNPPIDPIREELVMSLESTIGAEQNLFEETPLHCRQLRLVSPILTNDELEKIKQLSLPGLKSVTLPIVYRVADGEHGLRMALAELCRRASEAIAAGFTIIVLSDREMDAAHGPIPSLLATGAVHHHLVREGSRTKVGLVVESGEPREVMHFALLIGYGAGAVNPYLAYSTLAWMIDERMVVGLDHETAIKNYIKAIGKGLLKVASKMGISTLQSYRGAQIFEAVGLNQEFVERYFTGTASRIGGVGLEVIERETAARHERAFRTEPGESAGLAPGGEYQWRRRGELHMYNPLTIAKLQHAVATRSYKLFKQYTRIVDEEAAAQATLRGLLKFKANQPPIPITEVEPASEIVKRFKTGAMSFGAISKEAHEALAIAMNRIGGKSNTGEGGEDPGRFKPDPNGDWRRSAIKQVASGRFGVTSNYLVNADELQIKIAQGAKPGEGGQLPGHKVDEYIASIRYSTPGVGLISPPPHHDIYSIEDLAQLIHDLKAANEHAQVSVKLVAAVGVGTIAAGVAKAKADLILISGFDGGTGASPLSSIKHAGIPWELGLAETQQVLVLNDLRGRVRLETDGQLKTGRDVVIAALLGAEEFGFATVALVAMGCVMMRVCHLNTCPVGIATHDPILRQRFAGKPEHVETLMMFIAEEVREYMAQLGFRTLDEMVGRVEYLEPNYATEHWKARHVDLGQILHRPQVSGEVSIRCVETQDHELEKVADRRLIDLCKDALEHKRPVKIHMPIRNVDRAFGTMLSAEISRRYGDKGLAAGMIKVHVQGSAGQSFGAFLARGVALHLEGDANDYIGKGLSGGLITVRPPRGVAFKAEENILIGNVALYGATAGEAYFRGVAGERFAVRNSGANAVVEGVGDHACEYMTRGTVVVLGGTGRNFAAGMSGGVAYVLDQKGDFSSRCNLSMVELDTLSETQERNLVRSLVQRHFRYTGSELARHVLAKWQVYAARFVKVVPVEYRKVLQRQRLDSDLARVAAI